MAVNRRAEKTANPDRLDVLLTGLAAGDGLGSTSEFVSQRRITRVFQKHREQGWPFRQVGGGVFGWQPGQPTDDTDMALCMVRSYRALGRFDGADVAKRFVAWMRKGPPDIGGTTVRSLGRIASRLPWYEGGLGLYQMNPNNAANGSLMRNGVVAGMSESLPEAFRISLSQGLMTHYAPLPQICCAAQTYLLWELLEGHNPLEGHWFGAFRCCLEDWLTVTDDEVCLSWLRNVEHDLPAAWETFEAADWDTFDPFQAEYSDCSGYCLLTLQIAVWALRWSLSQKKFAVPNGLPVEVFERRGPWVLGWVAMIGEDSDTYGATAGPLIAAAHGGLPEDLTDGLWALRPDEK